MREPTRSRLRTILLLWMAAGATMVVGYSAAVAIFVFGFCEEFSPNASVAMSVGPMVLGCGLQLLLVSLFLRIRDRFEDRCWELISAELRTPDGSRASTQVLAKQVAGEDIRLAAVRARQSRHFAKRLKALVEQAWPPRANS